MSIRRAKLPFEGQYVQIPNAWMRDNRLTHRARGLLAEIMTHTDGWVISQTSIWRGSPEGREAIRKTVLELVEAGYLTVDQDRGELGRFGEVNYVLTAPEIKEVTATQKLGNGRKTGTRLTAPQKLTPKEEHLQEDQEKKGGADAPAPPPLPVDNSTTPKPWCARHAATEGTDRPCTACEAARKAYRVWEMQFVADARSDQWQPAKKQVKHYPGLCDAHRQPEKTCDACAEDRRKGRTA